MEPVYLLDHLKKQHSMLCMEGQVFVNDPSRDRAAVILEPRLHELLYHVIRNVMYRAGSRWNMHVFTAAENIGALQEHFRGCRFRVTPLGKNNITREEYSALLMSEQFWDMIPEENVLVFQTDCMLFRSGIDKWIDDPEHGFDYVGANYYNPSHATAITGGIQGGLSLRKKSAMIDCIKKITPDDVHRYRGQHGLKPLLGFMHEDVFFTHACEILNRRVPGIEKRREFSIEADYHPKALGHHGLNCRYLTADQQRELVSDA